MLIPLKHRIYFIVLFILFGVGYNYQHTLSMYPASKHKWRQSDAYSQTLNYYHENNPFLEPRIHLYNSVEGKGAGEFPILYYLNAKIWKITGESVFLIRFETMLFLFLGLFALFKLTAVFVKDLWFRLFVPFFVFVSPVIAFYGDNFLVNMSSLSFVFIAWNMIVRADMESKKRKMIPGFIILALAVLLRPTMIMAYLPLFIYFISDAIAKKNWRFFLISRLWYFVVSTIGVLTWVLYVRHYNDINHSVYFLTDLVPIWTQNVSEVWKLCKQIVLSEFYPVSFQVLLLAVFLYTVIKFRKRNRTFMMILISSFSLNVIYVVLWFGNFNVHDYYLIEFFVLVPLLLGGYFYLVEKNGHYIKLVKMVTLLVLLFYLLPSSITKTRIKYATSDAALAPLFVPDEEIGFWKWAEWYDKDRYQAFEEIRPLLRKHGIQRTDLVISLGDPTSNYTLSLMDQKGFTDLYNEQLNRTEKVKFYRDKGAKYLILNNEDLLPEVDSVYTNNPVLKYRNILVFGI